MIRRSLPLAVLLVAGCASAPQVGPVDWGAKPEHAETVIRRYFQDSLKDPESAQYGQITAPLHGEISRWLGLVRGGTKTSYGWEVDATVNAKNSFGGYVGFRTYRFLFHGDVIIDLEKPPAE